MTIPKLQPYMPNKDRRCQARVSYGDTWTAGRKQCSFPAAKGDELCKAHAKKRDAKL